MENILSRLSQYTPELLILGTLWYMATQACLDLARKRARKKLRDERRRRDAAESANRAKAIFLTSMSHEIRAPLSAIVGFTDLALKTPLSAELREYLGTVRASADWLDHVVNEVLDFARMEAGAIQISRADFCIRDILRSAVNIAHPLAAKRKLLLRLHLDSALPNHLQGDGTRLLQVVYNLIENATKFTTTGSVMVNAAVESRHDEAVTVRITVADTGVGITPERLEHIFEPLAIPVASLDRKSRTCGFGLPICQRLVNLMGGSMEVQSRPGIGSTFGFSLTFDTGAKEVSVAPQTATAVRKRLRILVADAVASSRLSATVLLQGAGHHVTEAVTGFDALRCCTAGQFDLILIDLEMPELNGLAATKAIRATEPEGHVTPIYALIAQSSRHQEQHCLKAGMTGVFLRPFSVEGLLQLVANISGVDPPGNLDSKATFEQKATQLISAFPSFSCATNQQPAEV